MMRAKLLVLSVESTVYGDRVKMQAVTCGTPEDNTYAEATPDAQLEMQINNPALRGKIKPGQEFYADFTLAPAPDPAN